MGVVEGGFEVGLCGWRLFVVFCVWYWCKYGSGDGGLWEGGFGECNFGVGWIFVFFFFGFVVELFC